MTKTLEFMVKWFILWNQINSKTWTCSAFQQWTTELNWNSSVSFIFTEKRSLICPTFISRKELIFVGDLDYERQSLHQLRVVAKDRANYGRINSATTGILIKVQDIEDKAPAFISVPSISRISEDVPTFSEVRQFLAHFFVTIWLISSRRFGTCLMVSKANRLDYDMFNWLI